MGVGFNSVNIGSLPFVNKVWSAPESLSKTIVIVESSLFMFFSTNLSFPASFFVVFFGGLKVKTFIYYCIIFFLVFFRAFFFKFYAVTVLLDVSVTKTLILFRKVQLSKF